MTLVIRRILTAASRICDGAPVVDDPDSRKSEGGVAHGSSVHTNREDNSRLKYLDTEVGHSKPLNRHIQA